MVDHHVVVINPSEAPEVEGGDGSGGGFGAVVIFLHAEKNGRVALGGGEVAAAVLVPELEVERVLQPSGPAEPAGVEIGLVEIEQSVDEEGVIGGEAGNGQRGPRDNCGAIRRWRDRRGGRG